MTLTRRHFLETAGAVTAGFVGLRHALAAAGDTPRSRGYGPLERDPEEVLDLPQGFAYRIISRRGDKLDSGLLLPGQPDGMATFAGPRGLTILIRNHELRPNQPGPFGEDHELLDLVETGCLYDAGQGKTPGHGGTSTVVYDTQRQKVVREFLSLVGTTRNCAGGPTPWKSWITCEETVDRAGPNERGYVCEKDHGYNFEVPARHKPTLADPVPLTDMGRFNHEAVAVDPATGIVYQTEDRDEGLLYRFLPNKPGELAAGGRLQALAFVDQPSVDTRNWDPQGERIEAGASFPVRWIDMEDVTAPQDDLRFRGFEAGAARFARGEGMWYGHNSIFFACTSGGAKKKGQIWRYVPGEREGQADEREAPGKLELFVEPNDSALVENADNLTVAPWGDLIVCEDRSGEVVRLVGVTPQGELYTFARNHLQTEFAGATFSPDGSTLFVNIQGAGLTLAITGPWRTT